MLLLAVFFDNILNQMWTGTWKLHLELRAGDNVSMGSSVFDKTRVPYFEVEIFFYTVRNGSLFQSLTFKNKLRYLSLRN